MNEIFDLEPRTWWDTPKAEADEDQNNPRLAQRLLETVMDIERRQNGISEGNRRHAKIYAGYLPNALMWGTSSTGNARAPFEATKAIIRSVCDTATALIVRSRPKATFVTDGADWKVQHQAEDMDQFMVGAYELSGIYQVAPRCFHDSTVFGTGMWKYVAEGTGDRYHVCTERVLPDDFIVDEEECRDHLDPQNTYHRTLVRTDALIKKYASGSTPEDMSKRYKIRAASATVSWPNRAVPKDYTILVEAVHLGDDPRHIIAVPGLILKDEAWPYEWHPYTILWWSQPISGFYGDGIAYRQYGRQQRVTYMYRWIQKCHDLFATPRAWVDPAGGVPTMQMSNELGAIIMSRKPPTIQSQNSVPPEIYSWLNNLEGGGYEDEGISQVSASNQLPPGLESAPAQREYSFKEGQRFAPVSQRWEYAIAVDAAMKMAAMYAAHSKATKSAPKMKWADRRLMHTIEWPDLPVDAYVIRPAASSLEALSPSARTQSAIELAQTGWIDPKEGRALLGHPDLDASRDIDTAPETYAKWILRKLYHGENPPVDELADMGTLDRIVRSGRLLAIQRNAPKAIVDGLARFLEELDQAKQAALASTMPPPGAIQPGMSPQSAMGAPAPFPGG